MVNRFYITTLLVIKNSKWFILWFLDIILLPDNYTDQDVTDAIKLCAEKFSSYEARKRIQYECKEKFDAKKNYDKFIDFLIEENNKFHKKRKNEEL